MPSIDRWPPKDTAARLMARRSFTAATPRAQPPDLARWRHSFVRSAARRTACRIPARPTTPTDAPKIPAAAVTEEDADLIAALAPQGPVQMHLVLTPQQLPDALSYNVIGDLKGTEHPEQVVIVSGHLDSWDLGTGAIDDGAGVAVAMQAPNLVRQLGLHPRRTIRVIAWMNEENGSRGGKTYAQEHAGEIANHFAAIETDLGRRSSARDQSGRPSRS